MHVMAGRLGGQFYPLRQLRLPIMLWLELLATGLVVCDRGVDVLPEDFLVETRWWSQSRWPSSSELTASSQSCATGLGSLFLRSLLKNERFEYVTLLLYETYTIE